MSAYRGQLDIEKPALDVPYSTTSDYCDSPLEGVTSTVQLKMVLVCSLEAQVIQGVDTQHTFLSHVRFHKKPQM